jgi:hypothetical protein
MPAQTPNAAASTGAETPIASDACVPSSTRENTSRPKESLPNQYSADGPWLAPRKFCSSGSCGTSHGPTSASTTSTATRTMPIVASVLPAM